MAAGPFDLAMSLVRLLEEHWDALDADFQRFYGLDLAAACWGPEEIGLRRLHVLIQHLPTDSALSRSMGWAWDDHREMTATLVELQHDQAVSARALVQAFSGKKFRGPPEPLRWPRPQIEVPVAPQPLSREQIRNTLLRRSG